MEFQRYTWPEGHDFYQPTNPPAITPYNSSIDFNQFVQYSIGVGIMGNADYITKLTWLAYMYRNRFESKFEIPLNDGGRYMVHVDGRLPEIGGLVFYRESICADRTTSDYFNVTFRNPPAYPSDFIIDVRIQNAFNMQVSHSVM